jgi:glycosyltransferase involved in cell wall biosynthesis
MMTLSYNKPVLVSDLPPLTEVINDKVNGYIFKSEDSNNLSLKLNEIFLDSEKLLDISNQGFKEVKEKFDWNSIGYLTDKAYGSIY